MQCLVLAVRRARARTRARARKAISVKSIMGNQVFGYCIGFRRTRTQRSGTQSAAADGTRTRWLFETAAMLIDGRAGSRERAELGAESLYQVESITITSTVSLSTSTMFLLHARSFAIR